MLLKYDDFVTYPVPFFCVCRGTGAHPELQQERGLVRGALGRPGGLGAVQLRDAGQLAGEALVVPRTHLAQRGRVPAQLWHQRQLPGARVGELPRPAKHLPALRGPRLPLPHQRGPRGQGNAPLRAPPPLIRDPAF